VEIKARKVRSAPKVGRQRSVKAKAKEQPAPVPAAAHGKNGNGMQKALVKGPGRFSAVCLYGQPADVFSPRRIRSKAAQLIRYFEDTREQPDGLYVLVALHPSLLPDDQRREAAAHGIGLPEGPFVAGDDLVFVQIAAQSDVHRLYALRIVHEAFGPHMRRCREIYGGKILTGEEPFGFADHAGGQYERQLAKKLPLGGAWLFFQRFRQDLTNFFDENQNLRTRTLVVGKPPAAVPPKGSTDAQARKVNPDNDTRASLAAQLVRAREQKPGRKGVVEAGAADSHVDLMEAEKGKIVRRGFPCRFDGEEGLAFVGVVAEPRTIPMLLERMIKGHDRLLEYVTGREGGVFFCPPSADSLDPDAPALVPTTVDPLSGVKHLYTYDTTTAFHDYLMLLKARGLFDNRRRPKKIAPELREAMDALYAALPKSNAKKKKKLQSAEEASFANAVMTNEDYDEYVTYG
jgi:hypothetical protein